MIFEYIEFYCLYRTLISATEKNDNLTCEIIYGNFTRDDYR